MPNGTAGFFSRFRKDSPTRGNALLNQTANAKLTNNVKAYVEGYLRNRNNKNKVPPLNTAMANALHTYINAKRARVAGAAVAGAANAGATLTVQAAAAPAAGNAPPNNVAKKTTQAVLRAGGNMRQANAAASAAVNQQATNRIKALKNENLNTNTKVNATIKKIRGTNKNVNWSKVNLNGLTNAQKKVLIGLRNPFYNGGLKRQATPAYNVNQGNLGSLFSQNQIANEAAKAAVNEAPKNAPPATVASNAAKAAAASVPSNATKVNVAANAAAKAARQQALNQGQTVTQANTAAEKAAVNAAVYEAPKTASPANVASAAANAVKNAGGNTKAATSAAANAARNQALKQGKSNNAAQQVAAAVVAAPPPPPPKGGINFNEMKRRVAQRQARVAAAEAAQPKN